ncbi:hypothetical protein WJ973_25510 [Achromobacter xylosoxidans]
MAYTIDMPEAANRHYIDGEALMKSRRLDNAGYHFGLATECVIKHVLSASHDLRPDDDAWWKHFPSLRLLAETFLKTRSQAALLRTVIEDQSLMQEWDIVMRYAPNGSVLQHRAEKWKDQANRALGLLYI